MDSISNSQALEIVKAVLKAAEEHGVSTERIVGIIIEFDTHDYCLPTPNRRPRVKPRIIQGMAETVDDLDPPPTPATDCTSQCATDILSTLEEVGHRLTTSELAGEMETRNRIWGESTLRGWLAKLVKEKRINNVPSGRQYKGYGFLNWAIPVSISFRLFCEEIMRNWFS